MNNPWVEPDTGITVGFAICAAINVGAGLKALLTGNAGNKAAWPTLFGDSGMVAIILWGLAYLSVCRTYPQCPWTVLVFGLEKLFYVVAWAALLKAKRGGAYANADGDGTTVGIIRIADPQRFALANVGGKELFGFIDLICGIFFFVVGGMTLAQDDGT